MQSYLRRFFPVTRTRNVPSGDKRSTAEMQTTGLEWRLEIHIGLGLSMRTAFWN